jgi:hypothetical protein
MKYTVSPFFTADAVGDDEDELAPAPDDEELHAATDAPAISAVVTTAAALRPAVRLVPMKITFLCQEELNGFNLGSGRAGYGR